MKIKRFLALSLAAALQMMPVLRAVLPSPALAASPAWALVLRVAGGTVALLGSYHAVSGATSINAPYTIVTNTGSTYVRQLTTAVRTAESWSANTAGVGSSVFPLTPGLWLTNSSGRIGGVPTWAGTSNITISAWEFTGNSGPSVSSVFTFTINAAGPPGIRTQPTNQTLNAGVNATFAVAAYGANTLNYQWRFTGAPIANATNSAYTLTNITIADAGAFSVVITNSLGAITSAVANLVVRSAPVITTQPASLDLGVGSNATFSVVASGTAPLGYQWRFNGANLASATTSAYSIPSAQTFNAGNYSVVITNSLGTNVSSNAVLTVSVPPVNLQSSLSGTNLALSFNALFGTNYFVQVSTDLVHWSTLTNLVASGTNITLSTPSTNTAGFFRVDRPSNQ